MPDNTPSGRAIMVRAVAVWRDPESRREVRAWTTMATLGAAILSGGAALTICLPIMLCEALTKLSAALG